MFFNSSLFVSPSGGRCDVGLPVHEAVHGRGDVQATPGFLQTTPQQLFWLFWSVPASRCQGSWTEPLRHLQCSIPPNEFKLPCPPQVSWLRSDVLIALLRLQIHISDIWKGESFIASSWRCCARNGYGTGDHVCLDVNFLSLRVFSTNAVFSEHNTSVDGIKLFVVHHTDVLQQIL